MAEEVTYVVTDITVFNCKGGLVQDGGPHSVRSTIAVMLKVTDIIVELTSKIFCLGEDARRKR